MPRNFSPRHQPKEEEKSAVAKGSGRGKGTEEAQRWLAERPTIESPLFLCPMSLNTPQLQLGTRNATCKLHHQPEGRENSHCWISMWWKKLFLGGGRICHPPKSSHSRSNIVLRVPSLPIVPPGKVSRELEVEIRPRDALIQTEVGTGSNAEVIPTQMKPL